MRQRPLELVLRYDDPVPLSPQVLPDELPPALHVMPLSDVELGSEVLGVGSSGVVLTAQLRDGRTVACKRIRVWESRTRKQALAEIRALSANDCEGIVNLLGVALEEEGAVLLLLELMDSGSLDRYVSSASPIPERALAGIAFQALWACSYLAYLSLSHRDVKPNNILLHSDGKVALADLGLARGGGPTTYVGTLRYMAPERCQRSAYGPAADVWGVGMSLLELVLGFYPYAPLLGEDAASQLAVVLVITEGGPPPPPPATSSPALTAFLAAALQWDPSARATAATLLEHPFLTGHGCTSLGAARALVAAWLRTQHPS